MKKTILILAAVFAFSTLGALSTFADDLEALAGKWVAEKTQGQSLKQTLEIKKNKFTFEVIGDGGQIVLHAEGEVKAGRLEPFKTARFFNIRAGSSAAELEAVDDERTLIYTLDGNELTVAMNFDNERAEPPTVTRYTRRVVADETKTLVIDKIVMHKTPQSAEWYFCFDATVGETTKRFHVADKTYEKDEVTIVTDLAVANVRKDQTCKFVMKLDDVAGDECTEQMDNKSTGSFSVTENGSQEFKPEGQWRYTIHWRLK